MEEEDTPEEPTALNEPPEQELTAEIEKTVDQTVETEKDTAVQTNTETATRGDTVERQNNETGLKETVRSQRQTRVLTSGEPDFCGSQYTWWYPYTGQ